MSPRMPHMLPVWDGCRSTTQWLDRRLARPEVAQDETSKGRRHLSSQRPVVEFQGWRAEVGLAPVHTRPRARFTFARRKQTMGVWRDRAGQSPPWEESQGQKAAVARA